MTIFCWAGDAPRKTLGSLPFCGFSVRLIWGGGPNKICIKSRAILPFSGRTAQVHNQKSSPFCPIEPRSPAAILPPSHLAMFSLVPGGNILAGLIPSLFLASIRWLIGFLDCNRCNFLINIGSQSVILWVFSLEHALFFFFFGKRLKKCQISKF